MYQYSTLYNPKGVSGKPLDVSSLSELLPPLSQVINANLVRINGRKKNVRLVSIFPDSK